jgi:hypothetical protein
MHFPTVERQSHYTNLNLEEETNQYQRVEAKEHAEVSRIGCKDVDRVSLDILIQVHTN